MSPEEEVVARERKRSVKFKDREVVSRISESENSDLNHGGAVEEVKAPENETQDVNVNSTKGGGEERPESHWRMEILEGQKRKLQ